MADEKQKGIKKHQPHDLEQNLILYQDEIYELVEWIQILKEKNILSILSNIKNDNELFDTNQIENLKKGVKKGIDEALLTLKSGKELNTFQLMKLMKDPDINRAMTFFLALFKGIGKNI